MERVKGLKPSAFALARRRSNQLSYTRRSVNSKKILSDNPAIATFF
jgi:hypothetical protein